MGARIETIGCSTQGPGGSENPEPLIVKFGGSAATSPDLPRWIEAVEASSLPVVMVPGGGPFANTVRRYQCRMGYNDDAAHEMALLAMEQFGVALVSLGTRMVRAGDPEEIRSLCAAGRIPVWMPLDRVLDDAAIARDWTVTSDSLAAWLAGRLGSRTLCLIKQIDVPRQSTIEALVGADILDTAFTALLPPDIRVIVAGPADLPQAARKFAAGLVPGNVIDGVRERSMATG